MISAEVIPFEQVDAAKFADAVIRDVIREIGKRALADFEEVVKNWKTKVTFKLTFDFSGDEYSFTVEPNDDEAGEIFNFVDFGTKPHVIQAKARTLSFTVPYRAATKPRAGRGRSGRAQRGVRRVHAKRVRHPGSEPRNFSIDIMAYWEKEGLKRIDAAWDVIIKEIGPIS